MPIMAFQMYHTSQLMFGNHLFTNLKIIKFMGLTESVKSVFGKYATFSGRATRSEYWYFVLFNILLEVCLLLLCVIGGVVLDGMSGAVVGLSVCAALLGLYSLGAFIPSLAVIVRRMHDTGRSGWFIFLPLVPLIGSIILLVFLITDSAPDNKYGPNPHNVEVQ